MLHCFLHSVSVCRTLFRFTFLLFMCMENVCVLVCLGTYGGQGRASEVTNVCELPDVLAGILILIP